MNLKELAARQALQYVQSGMTLGLGSGSTTAYFTDLLGEQLQKGVLRSIQVVPTSDSSAARARLQGIPVTTLAGIARHRLSPPLLDLAVDGADEVDPHLNLIKGLGQALLREKIVEIHAQHFIVIVDESKKVSHLGSKCPLPVEILPFEAEMHISWLSSLGCRAELWYEDNGSPVVTDNGNNLALCHFETGIPDPYLLAREMADRPGIIEHGLFLDMASLVIVAGVGGIDMMRSDRAGNLEVGHGG